MYIINPLNKILSILVVGTFLFANITYSATDTLRPMLPFGAQKGQKSEEMLLKARFTRAIKKLKENFPENKSVLSDDDYRIILEAEKNILKLGEDLLIFLLDAGSLAGLSELDIATLKDNLYAAIYLLNSVSLTGLHQPHPGVRGSFLSGRVTKAISQIEAWYDDINGATAEVEQPKARSASTSGDMHSGGNGLPNRSLQTGI